MNPDSQSLDEMNDGRYLVTEPVRWPPHNPSALQKDLPYGITFFSGGHVCSCLRHGTFSKFGQEYSPSK